MSNRIPIKYQTQYEAMVSAPQPEAVEAGLKVLKDGGNALDAAIACAMVQGVVDPLMCGIGGMGVMQIYDPVAKETFVYEGVGGCPEASTPDMWAGIYKGETTDGYGYILEGFVNEAGATSVTAPGIMKMLGQAHAEYGSTPWRDLFSDAISHANNGWLIRPHVHTVFMQNERKYGRLNYGEKLGITPDGRSLYLDANGDYKKPGDMVYNPELAKTLSTLANEGYESMYTGTLATSMVESVRAGGGILSMSDLENFVPRKVKPIKSTFRGWTIHGAPPPFGGLYVEEVLKLLEAFDLRALGHNTPSYIALLAEAMKIATNDKSKMTGDPDFQNHNSLDLLDHRQVSERVERIRSGQREVINREPIKDCQHTTHVSVVDKNGMFVSLTHTLANPSGFIVGGAGYMLNGGMNTYDPIPGRPNSIAPGKRRFSTMSPILVFDEDTPVISIGAPGASWIGPAIVQVLLNILEWGMDVQSAISAPRMVATGNPIDVSNRIPHSVQASLEAMNYKVRRTHVSYAFAGVHGITKFGGHLSGGADPQRDGYAGGV